MTSKRINREAFLQIKPPKIKILPLDKNKSNLKADLHCLLLQRRYLSAFI